MLQPSCATCAGVPAAVLSCWRGAAQIETSNRFMLGMIGLLVAGCFALGPVAMIKLYAVPYWINVMWLDAVTYLHHHGQDEKHDAVPWYRGKVPAAAPRRGGRAPHGCHCWGQSCCVGSTRTSSVDEAWGHRGDCCHCCLGACTA